MLDQRYDDLASGRVKPIDGEEALRRWNQRPKPGATVRYDRIGAPPGSIR